MTDERLKTALYDCATGLQSEETVKEYTLEDGEMKLVKMRSRKKQALVHAAFLLDKEKQMENVSAVVNLLSVWFIGARLIKKIK